MHKLSPICGVGEDCLVQGKPSGDLYRLTRNCFTYYQIPITNERKVWCPYYIIHGSLKSKGRPDRFSVWKHLQTVDLAINGKIKDFPS